MRMKRLIGMALMAMLVLGSGASYAQKKPDTVHYEVSMVSPAGNMGTRKAWRKGSNFRWEMRSPNMTIVSVRNDDGVFIIHPANRYAGKYPPGTLRESLMSYLPGPAGDVKAFLALQEAQESGEEMIGEVLCDVYTYVEKETKWDCKLWVNKKSGKPVKLFMQGVEEDDNMTATYKDYRVGSLIPDSRFDLPEGLPIVPMPDRTTTPQDSDGDKPDGEKTGDENTDPDKAESEKSEPEKTDPQKSEAEKPDNAVDETEGPGNSGDQSSSQIEHTQIIAASYWR